MEMCVSLLISVVQEALWNKCFLSAEEVEVEHSREQLRLNSLILPGITWKGFKCEIQVNGTSES